MKKPVVQESGGLPTTVVSRKLREVGIQLQQNTLQDRKANQQRLLNISVWNDQDIKLMEDTRQAFGAIKSEEW